MATETEKRMEMLRSQWNYIDVLMLALAYLPKGANRLTADSAKWNETVAEVKQAFRETAPELLARVHFRFRPPLAPHSDELDEFFKCVGVSGRLGAVNPAYQVFDLSEETKSQIIATRENKLSKYKNVIREIASYMRTLTYSGVPSERADNPRAAKE